MKLEIEIFLPAAGKGYVYKLVDPFTQEIRYIGSTNNPGARFRDHVLCPWGASPVKNEWVKSLIARGVYPRMFVIETCDFDERLVREQIHIRKHLQEGHNLTNAYAKYGKYFAADVLPDKVILSRAEASLVLGYSYARMNKLIADGRLNPLPKQNPNRDKEPLRFNRADVLALAQPRPKDKPLGG